MLQKLIAEHGDILCARLQHSDGTSRLITEDNLVGSDQGRILVCLQDPAEQEDLIQKLEAAGMEQDPDVLDTWFSSGLNPKPQTLNPKTLDPRP